MKLSYFTWSTMDHMLRFSRYQLQIATDSTPLISGYTRVGQSIGNEGGGEEEMVIMESSSSRPPHIVLFPFMSKGHTIPILQLASLLLRRRHGVTIFTTPANRPFISQYLSNSQAAIIDLPFPEHVPGLPVGVESTDKLPSVSDSFFLPFVQATKLLQPHFEREMENLRPVDCMVSDGFLGWTQSSASKFGIPRLVFYGMCIYAMTITRIVLHNGLLFGPQSDDEPFSVPEFPRIRLTKNDFVQSFRQTNGVRTDFVIEAAKSTSESAGLIVNSFLEIDSVFLDYWNREIKNPKAWSIGPLCLVEPPRVERPHEKPKWLQWLDLKLAQGNPVLYVAFGSQTDISPEQLQEIATGLEESEANFLWVMRARDSEIGNGFEERVKDRGILVPEWVDQRQILSHGSVRGFLSHCGWNSVLESVCAAVPILAWPMMAEQHLNARLVVEEMKVGVRVETADGSVRGFVKKEGLEKTVRDLMEGERGKRARDKVKEFALAGKVAIEDGGSSWKTLNLLIDETCNKNSLNVVV